MHCVFVTVRTSHVDIQHTLVLLLNTYQRQMQINTHRKRIRTTATTMSPMRSQRRKVSSLGDGEGVSYVATGGGVVVGGGGTLVVAEEEESGLKRSGRVEV